MKVFVVKSAILILKVPFWIILIKYIDEKTCIGVYRYINMPPFSSKHPANRYKIIFLKFSRFVKLTMENEALNKY